MFVDVPGSVRALPYSKNTNTPPQISSYAGLIVLSFLQQLPVILNACDLAHGGTPSSAYTTYDAFDPSATGTNIAYMAVLAPGYLLLAIGIDVALSHPFIRRWFQMDLTAEL
jgi:hypothetical protein